MLATERLLEIETKFGVSVERIVPVELDGETLRLILYLKDGTNLRVTEQWSGSILARYSYYWLTAGNELKVGWDNAPHHTRLETHPHHKHVGRKENLQPSSEACLEEAMGIVLAEVAPTE
ncbi:MAG: DUF6516 family protein [Pseudomonadota bacterium]